MYVFNIKVNQIIIIIRSNPPFHLMYQDNCVPVVVMQFVPGRFILQFLILLYFMYTIINKLISQSTKEITGKVQKCGLKRAFLQHDDHKSFVGLLTS